MKSFVNKTQYFGVILLFIDLVAVGPPRIGGYINSKLILDLPHYQI